MVSISYSTEPRGRFSSPCMGCGKYYAEPGKHICGHTKDGCLTCQYCIWRGFRTSEDNRDLISQMNHLGVVFEYQITTNTPKHLHTFFGKPRKLQEDEIRTLVEIENPLYDAKLGEKYEEFLDKFPQNPKMIRILAGHKDRAEAMRRSVVAKQCFHHHRENFPSTFLPLDFMQPDFLSNNVSDQNIENHLQINPLPNETHQEGLTSSLMKDLTPTLLSLDEDGRDYLIRTLVRHGIPTSGILDGSDFDAFMSKTVELHGWKTTTVVKVRKPGESTESSYNVEHVENARDVLQRLVTKGENLNMCLEFKDNLVTNQTDPRYGERIYGEVCQGDAFAKIQMELDAMKAYEQSRGRDTSNTYILPLSFYHDKSQTGRQRQTIYPCNVGIPTCKHADILSNHCQERIAMLPTFTDQCFKFLSLQNKKDIKRWIVTRAIEHILMPFKQMSVCGVYLVYKGKLCKFYPVPLFVSGDWQEYQSIAGVSASSRASEDNLPDVETLVPGSKLDAIACRDEQNRPFQKRTEANTLKVIEKAQQVLEARIDVPEDSERYQEALKVLKSHSLSRVFIFRPDKLKEVTYWLGEDGSHMANVSIPYAGFRWTDCFRLYVSDYLHTIQEGIIVKMLGLGNEKSAAKSLFSLLLSKGRGIGENFVRKKISTSIKQSSKPKNFKKMPASLFVNSSSHIMYGEEKSAMASVALVACLLDERLYPMIPVLEAFLEMDSMLHARLYTESCIEKLEFAIIDFQKVLRGALEDIGSSCRFPKFHILPRFDSSIKRIGCPVITSTAHQEATHKTLKAHHRHTNNHRETVQKQINDFAIMHDLTRDIKREYIKKNNRASKQRKCIQTEALQCPTKPDFTLSFQIIKNEGPEFSRICHTCPQMKQLISVLEEIIKQHCSISGNLPLERYCTDINVKVELYNKCFFPFRRGPGYDVECVSLIGIVSRDKKNKRGTLKNMQMIQVESPNQTGEMWYAQFLCLVRLTGTIVTRESPTYIDCQQAIIQWYQAADSPPNDENLIQRYTLYEIERNPERVQVPGVGSEAPQTVSRRMDFVDSCQVTQVQKPVFFQLHPDYLKKTRKKYYLNIDA